MTTKPKAKKFRVRRSGSVGTSAAANAPARPDTEAEPPTPEVKPTDAAMSEPTGTEVSTPSEVSLDAQIDGIRKEGLTGRQLRMARRVAQKHGLAPVSDFDAVRQLRDQGIDPFQREHILELVVPGEGLGEGVEERAIATQPAKPPVKGRVQLPQTVPAGGTTLPSTNTAVSGDQRAIEIRKIQQDISRRRRLKLIMLMSRLAVFVGLPTLIAGWYFYVIATPMYSTHSQFVVQTAEPQGSGGIGSLFQGTGLAVQQDSTGVQAFLQSRDAMLRLDEDLGFKAHFSDPAIDDLQRLPPDASNEAAYDLYQDHVVIGYDPSEGILKLEVIAADPDASVAFATALIGYAEERVDQQTIRVREDQMRGARGSFEEAQARREAALAELAAIQQDVQSIDPVGEVASLLSQITTLETERIRKDLELQSLQDVRRPNQARVNAIRSDIDRLDDQISALRSRMTDTTSDGASLSEIQGRLRRAEENYAFEVAMVQAAQQSMETSRIEADRQTRYLSLNVEPVAPDEPSYPRAFENTLLTFLVLSGIYLMISLTASILREQVTS